MHLALAGTHVIIDYHCVSDLRFWCKGLAVSSWLPCTTPASSPCNSKPLTADVVSLAASQPATKHILSAIPPRAVCKTGSAEALEFA